MKVKLINKPENIIDLMWTPEKAFTTPIKDPIKRIEYRGKTKPLKQWCKELNMSYPKTANRIRRGWTIEDSFEK